jgi:hypothetical protein
MQQTAGDCVTPPCLAAPLLGPSISEDHDGVYEPGAPLFGQCLGPEWPQCGPDAPGCSLPK